MNRVLYKWVDDRMLVLTRAEVAEFDQLEADAAARRLNQVAEKTEREQIAVLTERIAALEAKQR